MQTMEALTTLQQHAVGELEFLVTSGQRGASTALPLTESQKARKAQRDASAKAAIAAAASSANREGSIGQADTRPSAKGEGKDSKQIVSNVHNPDKKACHSWQRGLQAWAEV